MLKKFWWLVFLPITLIPLTWLRAGEWILAVDFPFPLSSATALQRSFFPWDQTDNLGWIFGAQFFPTKLPVYFSHYLSELLRLNPQKIWFMVSLVAPAIAMALLTDEVLVSLDSKKRRVAAIVAGFFTTFNLYLLVQILDQPMMLQLVFVSLVLMLSFRATRTKQFIRYGLATSLASVGLAVWNPSSSAAGLIVIAISWLRGLFLKYRAKEKVALKGFTSFIGVALLGGLLVSSWWLVPFVASLSGFVSETEIPTSAWLTGTSAATSLTNTVRLIGAWDWFASFNEQPYAPYAAQYLGLKPVGLLAFLPAVLALVGWLKRPNRSFNLFALLAVLGIVLAAGAHPPTGPIYRFLFENLPGFWLFRSPWYKFSLWIVIGFAPLIGWATVWLASRLRVKGLWVSSLVIVLFALLSLPLITGQRFPRPEPGRTLASHRYVIPDYVFKTAQFLNSQPDQGRVLLLPQLFHDTTKYSWGYGSIRNPIYDLLENRAIVYRFFGQKFDYTALLDKLVEALRSGDQASVHKVLDLLGIRYVINQQDFDLEFFKNDPSPQDLDRYLKLLGGKLAYQAGQWQVYDLGATQLAQGLTGAVPTERFDNLFEQEFPKQAALVGKAPSELGDRSGGMVRLTLDDIKKENGSLETSFAAPITGSYQIKGKIGANLKINSQLLKQSEKIDLKPENQFSLEPSDQLPLTNSNFASGLDGWLVQNLALKDDKSIKRGVVPVQTEGGNAAELRAVEDWVALYRDLPALNVHAIVASFDLEQESGQFELAVDRPETHKSFPILTDSEPKKRHYDLLISGEIFDQPTQLYFYSRPEAGADGLVRVSNVVINLIKQPVEIFLVKPPSGIRAASFRFDRLSPTKIKLETDSAGPFVIHVKEHYDPDWSLRSDGFAARPIKVNEATMAFVVDRADLKQFTLEFDLTKTYWAGMTVSIATLAALLAVLGLSYNKRR